MPKLVLDKKEIEGNCVEMSKDTKLHFTPDFEISEKELASLNGEISKRRRKEGIISLSFSPFSSKNLVIIDAVCK